MAACACPDCCPTESKAARGALRAALRCLHSATVSSKLTLARSRRATVPQSNIACDTVTTVDR